MVLHNRILHVRKSSLIDLLVLYWMTASHVDYYAKYGNQHCNFPSFPQLPKSITKYCTKIRHIFIWQSTKSNPLVMHGWRMPLLQMLSRILPTLFCVVATLATSLFPLCCEIPDEKLMWTWKPQWLWCKEKTNFLDGKHLARKVLYLARRHCSSSKKNIMEMFLHSSTDTLLLLLHCKVLQPFSLYFLLP